MPLTNKDEIIFATVATASYLSRAIIMAESIKKHMKRSRVIICLVEEKIPDSELSLDTYFDEIILAKNLGFPNFYHFIFRYNQAEGSNACKAQLFICLLETYKNHDCFVFLDADTKVFGPFDELMPYFKTREIILSPHFVQLNEEDPLYHLKTIHKSGIFNTGFFAVKRGDESYKFLHWWARILLKYCYMDRQKGIWNEQKWLDLTPGMFDYYIQKDPGYNIGPWNFHERLLKIDDKGEYLVNGEPLRLFHFSGADTGYFKKRMEQTDLTQKMIIDKLKREYLEELNEVDKDLCKLRLWSYNYFSKGRPVDHNSRLIFRNNMKLFRHIDNPFLKSNQFFKLSLEQEDKKQEIKNKKKIDKNNKQLKKKKYV